MQTPTLDFLRQHFNCFVIRRLHIEHGSGTERNTILLISCENGNIRRERKKPASDNLTRVIVSPKLSGLAQLRICMRAEGATLEASPVANDI